VQNHINCIRAEHSCMHGMSVIPLLSCLRTCLRTCLLAYLTIYCVLLAYLHANMLACMLADGWQGYEGLGTL